jgi:hypothetical protein
MLLLGREKDLRFVHQAAEGLRMKDPVAVALELGAAFAFFARKKAPLRIGSAESEGRKIFLLSFQKEICYCLHKWRPLLLSFCK